MYIKDGEIKVFVIDWARSVKGKWVGVVNFEGKNYYSTGKTLAEVKSSLKARLHPMNVSGKQLVIAEKQTAMINFDTSDMTRVFYLKNWKGTPENPTTKERREKNMMKLKMPTVKTTAKVKGQKKTANKIQKEVIAEACKNQYKIENNVLKVYKITTTTTETKELIGEYQL